MLNDLLYRLRALIHSREMDAEVDDELRDHLERETEKYRRAGFTPNEAVRRAHLAEVSRSSSSLAIRAARNSSKTRYRTFAMRCDHSPRRRASRR
jgi:hypothetical protein